MNIIENSLRIATTCADKLNLEIVSVDYVLENGIKILRVIAKEKEQITENGLTIDEATSLNEAISAKLDEEDFIEEEYYLEVSSEGLEKELRSDKDILESCGKYVCVKTYEKIDGLKEIYGDLISFNDDILDIQYIIKGRTKKIQIQKSKISKIRLAVKF